MPLEDGLEMILKAIKEREKDKAWQLYLTVYPNMEEKTFKPFEEFYSPQESPKVDNSKSVDEILEDVKNILKKKEVK